MTLPAFATLEQLAARIPGGIRDADEARAQAALDDASTLIRSEVSPHAGWTTAEALDADVPDIVVMVTLWAARRSYENPEGVSEESLGQYSVSLGNSSSDVYLTAAERRHVRKAAGFLSIGVVATTRGDAPDVDALVDGYGGETNWVPVEPAGQALPVDYP